MNPLLREINQLATGVKIVYAEDNDKLARYIGFLVKRLLMTGNKATIAVIRLFKNSVEQR